MFGEKNRSAVDVGRDTRAAQHGRSDRDSEEFGVIGAGRIGTDRLRRTLQRNVEKFVERGPFDVGTGEVLAEVGPAPHGDHGEGFAVGQIEAFDPKHVIGSEDRLHALGGPLEREFENTSLGSDTTGRELRFDGGQTTETLLQRLGGHEPAESLTGVEQSVVAQ